jgi:hypothetical protein
LISSSRIALEEMDSAKRSHDDASTSQPLTDAAKFNALILKGLQRALESDPEANLLSKLPTHYSERLSLKKGNPETDEGKIPHQSNMLLRNI